MTEESQQPLLGPQRRSFKEPEKVPSWGEELRQIIKLCGPAVVQLCFQQVLPPARALPLDSRCHPGTLLLARRERNDKQGGPDPLHEREEHICGNCSASVVCSQAAAVVANCWSSPLLLMESLLQCKSESLCAGYDSHQSGHGRPSGQERTGCCCHIPHVSLRLKPANSMQTIFLSCSSGKLCPGALPTVEHSLIRAGLPTVISERALSSSFICLHYVLKAANCASLE